MTPNEIRAEFMRLGKPISSIADELNLPRSSISVVISGKRPNPKVRNAIARAINRPVNEIWPPKGANK